MSPKNKKSLPVIIFTDLDGTMLNHDDYSYHDALQAVEKIMNDRIPLIICTSKTRHEVLDLKNELNLTDPFITENGGGIFIRDHFESGFCKANTRIDGYQVMILGKPYQEIRSFFMLIQQRFPVTGFGDITVRDIMRFTGLKKSQAENARNREFTEPFLFHDEMHFDELNLFATQHGFKIVKGGRFYHLIGSDQDKGRAVRRVVDLYQDFYQKEIITIGAGDSMNDYAMLKTVNYPVLIPHPDGQYEPMDIPNLMKASVPGSKGWNDAILKLLRELA